MADIQMIPLVPSIIGLAAAVVLSFASGWKVRGDAEKARQLEVERGWHEKYKQGVAEAQAAAETAGAALRVESAVRAEDVAKLRSELANARRGAVRLATCGPAPQPVVPSSVATPSAPVAIVADGGDRVVLTPDFRLRYDTALSLVVPAGDRPGWLETAGAAAGPVGLWDVLDNATENAGRWAQCREMMTAAQTWFKTMGWTR